MAKITYADKVSVNTNQLPEINKVTDANLNEVKQSVNDLYDEVGAGAVSDNLIVFSINTVGDLADMIAGITDAASDNIYKIEIRPGTYTTAPVILKSYIYINGVDKEACIFKTITAADTIFTLVENSGVGLITIEDATSGIGISKTDAGFSFANDVRVNDCQTALYVNNVAASVESDISVGGTLADAIVVEAGSVLLRQPAVTSGTTATTFIKGSGATTFILIDRPITTSSNVTTGFDFNGCTIIGNSGTILGCVDGIIISGNNANVRFTGLNIINCTNDGIRIDNIGTNISLSMFSVTTIGSGNLELNVLNPNSSLIGNGSSDMSKYYVVDGADTQVYVIDSFAGDEGLKNFGEFSVGSQLRPSESIFGEGDSHPYLRAYSQISTGAFTDRTDAAKSSSGSTFTFDDLLEDSAIYIANDLFTSAGDSLIFHGLKTSIDTACVCNYGDVVAEYWNGSAWTEFNGSTQLSIAPHWKYRKEYFDRTGSYHIKFNPAILTDWAESDPMSEGNDRHWMRFRLTTTITTAPIFEQFKISTSRTELNEDGSKESHGYGRTVKKLTLDAAGPIEGAMQSSDMYVDQNVGVAFDNNRYTATGDIYGFSFELPEDCDTSIPVIITWKGKFASIGNPQFTIRRNIVAPGDAYTNGEPGASGNTQTVLSTIRTVAVDVREDFSVEIDVSDAIPSRSGGFGDEIWVTIQNTTRSGNFDHTKYSANYGSDFNGRHLKQS